MASKGLYHREQWQAKVYTIAIVQSSTHRYFQEDRSKSITEQLGEELQREKKMAEKALERNISENERIAQKR